MARWIKNTLRVILPADSSKEFNIKNLINKKIVNISISANKEINWDLDIFRHFTESQDYDTEIKSTLLDYLASGGNFFTPENFEYFVTKTIKVFLKNLDVANKADITVEFYTEEEGI